VAATGLSLTADVAQAAYCVRREIPSGCLYKPSGQKCYGVNRGEKMILDRQSAGDDPEDFLLGCPPSYCETLDSPGDLGTR